MIESERAVRVLHPFPGIGWTEIRSAAVAFAEHGWPVVPGTYQLAEWSAWLGKPKAGGLEPVEDLWVTESITAPEIAENWWTRRPYSVLLACGKGVDALEVPASHGERALQRLRADGQLGPIAVTPFGTWLLFVRSGEPLRTALALNPQTQLHSYCCWVPLPPTTRGQLPYRWRMSPTAVAWSLPPAGTVQHALIDAMRHTAATGTTESAS